LTFIKKKARQSGALVIWLTAARQERRACHLRDAWARLKGENQLPKVVRGVKFQNGVEVIETPAHNAA
jgi:hypothetical protein